MLPPRTEFEIEGKNGKAHKFVVKETTIKNRNFVQLRLREYTEAIQASARRIMEDPEVLLMSEEEINKLQGDAFDRYKMEFDMFCWLTEGPHSELDIENFNIKYTEAAKASFLPASNSTTEMLLGLLA